jgi:hypothetical protein
VYVKDLKGQVIQALHSCKFTPTNSSTNQWNAKSLGLPYFVKYLANIFVIYQREKVQYCNNKNVITLVKIEKGQKAIDWGQIIFNSLCSELDQWYKYVKDNKEDKKDTYQFALVFAKIF